MMLARCVLPDIHLSTHYRSIPWPVVMIPTVSNPPSVAAKMLTVVPTVVMRNRLRAIRRERLLRGQSHRARASSGEPEGSGNVNGSPLRVQLLRLAVRPGMSACRV